MFVCVFECMFAGLCVMPIGYVCFVFVLSFVCACAYFVVACLCVCVSVCLNLPLCLHANSCV